MSASYAPLLVMTIVSSIGAFDVLYYHVYRFRLYAQPSAQWETATHLARGLLFAAGAYLMTRYEPRGAWFWVVTGVIALDFVNNVADVLLEPRARAPLGGLPPLEYLIHIIGATASGLIGGLWFAFGLPLADHPTELAPPGELPGWLALNGYLLAAGGLAMAVFEAALLVRARHRSPLPAAV